MSSGYVRQSSGAIVTGHIIQAADLNAEFNALQSAFDNTIGHIHDGTVGGGGLIPSIIFTAGTVGGTANAITITGTSPANFALANGELITFTPISANTSTAVTININSTGAIPLMKITPGGLGTVLIGDVETGQPILIQYNSVGGYFLYLNIVFEPFVNPVSTNQSITFANFLQQIIATTAVTLTIAQSTGLGPTFSFWVFAQGGNVLVTPFSSDKINGGTAGASVTVPKGNLSLVNTDGNGNVYVTNTNYFFANTFQTSGNFPVTLTATASTNVTLPTGGTLVGSSDTGTVTNTMLAGSIAASKLIGTDIATVGTITAGTWNATVIAGQYGGTGVANTGKTITLGGNLTTSGAFTTTLTVTANTSVTLPTTGTLATLAGTETLTNKTLTNPVISGGTINNATIGGITPASGSFTNVNVTGSSAPANGMYLPTTNTVGISAGSTDQVIITPTASAVNLISMTGGATGNDATITVGGSSADASAGLVISTKGTSASGIRLLDSGAQQAIIFGSSNAVNSFQLSGGATGSPAAISVQGEATSSLLIYCAGSGNITLQSDNTATTLLSLVRGSSSAGDHLTFTNQAAGSGPTVSVTSTATNAPLIISAKGTGTVNIGAANLTGIPVAPTASANTSTTQIATTAFANPGNSITGSYGATGWVELPSGLILQWGNFTTSGASGSTTFPKVFPTAVLNVTATCTSTSTINIVNIDATTPPTTSGFTARTWAFSTGSSENVNWFAIGY